MARHVVRASHVSHRLFHMASRSLRFAFPALGIPHVVPYRRLSARRTGVCPVPRPVQFTGVNSTGRKNGRLVWVYRQRTLPNGRACPIDPHLGPSRGPSLHSVILRASVHGDVLMTVLLMMSMLMAQHGVSMVLPKLAQLEKP